MWGMPIGAQRPRPSHPALERMGRMSFIRHESKYQSIQGEVAEMVMFRGLLFSAALLAAGSLAAQEFAISGKDFLSGAGDAKIAELARQAAASGKTLVITAPPYWQDKASAKAHAGAANASIRTSDAFFENVMVRIEDAKGPGRAAAEAAPKAAPAVAAKAEPRPEAPKPVAPAPKPVVQAPAPPPKVQAPVAAPPKMEVAAEPAQAPAPAPAPIAVAPPPAPAPTAPAVVAPTPAAPAAPAVAKAAAAPPDASAAIKQRMQQNLNAGQPADGTLQVAQLQKDDLIFVDGPVRAVVRRFGPRTQLHWLEGDLNLDRAELTPTGKDRYRVNDTVRNVANPTLRGGTKGGALKLVAAVPAAKSPARTSIERQYNDARPIEGTLQATDLKEGDLLYTGEGSAVVIRRSTAGVERYWFNGELDLRQNGLQTQGNAIRVLTDTIK